MKLNFGNTLNTTGEAALTCPICECPCLHHGKVEIFHRNSDGPTGTHIEIIRGRHPASGVNNDMRLNPSRYDDGVLIHLWCEGCDSKLALQIAQHKGETLMQIGKVDYSIDYEAQPMPKQAVPVGTMPLPPWALQPANSVGTTPPAAA